jgi:hypothetical protein
MKNMLPRDLRSLLFKNHKGIFMKIIFISALLFCNTLVTASEGTMQSATGLLFKQIQADENLPEILATINHPEVNFGTRLQVDNFKGKETAYLSLLDFTVHRKGENRRAILEALLKKRADLKRTAQIFTPNGSYFANALEIAIEALDEESVTCLCKCKQWSIRKSLLDDLVEKAFTLPGDNQKQALSILQLIMIMPAK